MKAIVTKQYGTADVLQLEEIEKPTIGSDELLIQVMNSSVNPIDWRVRSGEMKIMTGIMKPPQVLGTDFAGVVSEVGQSITRFKKGDQVYGAVNGMKGGAYAEYLKVKEIDAALKPDNISFEQAASLPLVSLTAYQAIVHIGQAKSGNHILINGCTGGVGSAGVQIAKALGCTVTGVCSTKNVEFAKSLGANHVIDYKKDNVLENKHSYDVIFDTVGNHSFSEFQKTLKAGGICVTSSPTMPAMILALILNPFRSEKSKVIMVSSNSQDLDAVGKMIQEEKLKPQIAEVFPLAQIKDAHALSEKGRVVGKIVIKIQ
ncbi:NAD(P)-dependent alcohol dehydrogenase [Anaerolineales bacterium HSG24]|nr:NAD(P)-dependent alcohol dehydrogenase [Anaerolineales bacterium HSG24]